MAQTWIGSIEDKPGGIGPDNPIQSAEVHKYWAFWFKGAGAAHSPKNHFAPDATLESIKLTFADPSPDVKFFQPGDVVQTSPDEVKVISRDPVARTMVVDGGNWLGSDGSGSGVIGTAVKFTDYMTTNGSFNPDGEPRSRTDAFNGDYSDDGANGGDNKWVYWNAKTIYSTDRMNSGDFVSMA